MKIFFLQTGGTIDKSYPSGIDNHGYNFLISTPAFERILEHVHPGFEFETKTVLQKDSLDITENDRRLIYDACQDSNCNKIVITHGTDTMIQTGELLNTLTNKTIVLTGALKPELFKDSDADFNLGAAIGAVSALENGVYIVMGGRVLNWQDAIFDTDSGQFTSKTKN